MILLSPGLMRNRSAFLDDSGASGCILLCTCNSSSSPRSQKAYKNESNLIFFSIVFHRNFVGCFRTWPPYLLCFSPVIVRNIHCLSIPLLCSPGGIPHFLYFTENRPSRESQVFVVRCTPGTSAWARYRRQRTPQWTLSVVSAPAALRLQHDRHPVTKILSPRIFAEALRWRAS